MIKEGFVSFMSALLVKLAAYFLISLLYVLLILWAGIIENFSWRYVIVLTVTLLLIRIFLAEIFIKSAVVMNAPKRKK